MVLETHTTEQQYENEDFYEVDGDDADDNGENDSGGRQERNAGFGDQVEQCGCQGPDGQHRCEVAAAEDGRCELEGHQNLNQKLEKG